MSYFAGAQKLELVNNWTYSFSAINGAEPVSRPSEKEGPWVEKDTMLRKSGLVFFKRKVVLPSSLKQQWNNTGVAALYLGRVLQADETYFNGTLIGKNGSSDVQRVYIIPDSLVNWDNENTIEMKVEHWGQKGGTASVPYLAEAKPVHLFAPGTIGSETIRTTTALNKNTTYTLQVKNNLDKPVNGVVIAKFFNNKNVLLHTAEKGVSLTPGANSIPFAYRSPASFVKIVYTLSIPTYRLSLNWNQMAGYEPVVYKQTKPALIVKVPLLFEPAKIFNQKMGGWLGERFNINEEKRLKQVDELALLEGYFNKPGKHPWIGEHVGKFLEAACNTYKSTRDAALKIQIDRTVQQLLASQKEDGYLGTYTADNEWTSWDVWSHKYNLVGLLSYFELSGYQPALEGAKKIGDLLVGKFGTGAGQLNIVKAGAHVGMAATSVLDPMTDLYQFTGNKKYLDFCYYIVNSYDVANGPAIIKTLNATGRVDKTANAKAYEMLSNLVGLVKLYKMTGDTSVLNPVMKAWTDIADNRLYITGTTSSFEHFKDDDLLPASPKDNMGEGCVTTTWIQLNYQLLTIFGRMDYINELERAVYNHLAGAENPQTGCVSYYTPLQGKKPYGCNITCCMSSVPRGIAMIPLFANGQLRGNPVFDFYQPGTFATIIEEKGKKQAVQFATTTDFLKDGNVAIQVNPTNASNFTVLLRKPYWATNITATVNGLAIQAGQDDFISVKRQWKKGDNIRVYFDMPVMVLDGGISYPGMVALQRGPQVLAFDRSLNSTEEGKVQLPWKDVMLQPAILPANWIGKEGFELTSDGTGKPIVLVPYADASQTGGEVSTWMKKK